MSPKEMWGLLFWGIKKNIERAKKTDNLPLDEAPALAEHHRHMFATKISWILPVSIADYNMYCCVFQPF